MGEIFLMYGFVSQSGMGQEMVERGEIKMLTIIEVAARADGGHGLQSQSHRTECWLEGWVAVPTPLEAAVWACGGYCDLCMGEDGQLTNILPKERPVREESVSAEEQLRADVDYLAALQGVSL